MIDRDGIDDAVRESFSQCVWQIVWFRKGVDYHCSHVLQVLSDLVAEIIAMISRCLARMVVTLALVTMADNLPVVLTTSHLMCSMNGDPRSRQ